MTWRDDLAGALAHLPEPVRRAVPGPIRADVRHRLHQYRPGDVDFHPEPPMRGLGEVTGPPDFVVAGAPEEAVHRWFALLAAHPGVRPAGPEEPAARYFARFATEGFGPAQVDAFHRWFPRRPGHLAGLWAPDLLAHPWAVPLLAEAAPEARLVVVLADPVAQLQARLRQTAATRSPHPGSADLDAVDRGLYGHHLVRLDGAFPGTQVLVLQWEVCAADPAGQLARCRRFLGLAADEGSGTVAPLGPVPPLGAEPRARLHQVFAADLVRLAGAHPEIDLDRWPTAGDPTPSGGDGPE